MNDEPTSRADAWAHLGDMIAMVVALFGAPAALAAQRILRAATRTEILHWLAPLEALARRLLLLEAAALPPCNAPPPRPRAGRIASTLRDAPAPAPEDPAQWRVRFSLWPHGARRGNREIRSGATSPLPLQNNALALAKRMEALSRLLQDRKPHIRRMARLLAARRDTAFTAFAPYRFPGPVFTLLAATQAQVDAALSFSPSGKRWIAAQPQDG